MSLSTAAASLIAIAVAAPLLVFSLRRILFTIAALGVPAPRSPSPQDSLSPVPSPAPHLLVLIPCRNDGASLPGLINCLIQNGYPHSSLHIVVIDDGSTDDSPAVAQHLAEDPAEVVRVLCLPANQGKAAALNAGLQADPWGDIVVVYDADHRPQPGGLAALAAAFVADDRLGGASGRTEASNALVSPSAYYSAVERMVHQRLTMVAKDRLQLAPALLGSHCAYRRSLLEGLGGFAPGAFLEDSDLTIRIAAAGFRTRYVEDVPAFDHVPSSVRSFWRQHLRWSRGFQDVASSHGASVLRRRLPLRLRLELLIFSLGYLDRLALLAAAVLLLSDALLHTGFGFPLWLFLIVLALPYLQVMAVFWRTHQPAVWWLRLPFLFLLFPVDVLVAVRSTLDTLFRRPRLWTPMR